MRFHNSEILLNWRCVQIKNIDVYRYCAQRVQWPMVSRQLSTGSRESRCKLRECRNRGKPFPNTEPKIFLRSSSVGSLTKVRLPFTLWDPLDSTATLRSKSANQPKEPLDELGQLWLTAFFGDIMFLSYIIIAKSHTHKKIR